MAKMAKILKREVVLDDILDNHRNEDGTIDMNGVFQENIMAALRAVMRKDGKMNVPVGAKLKMSIEFTEAQ